MNAKGDHSLIGYSTDNIGDDIQSVASSRFLPSIDRFINRENMWCYDGPKTKMILNAFYMDTAKHFPFSKNIEPLLTSMHFTPKWRDGIMKRGKEYFLENGPVGCRDVTTLEYMRENDVPAYYSGCLTLTLLSNPEIEKQDYVLAVDLPKETVDKMRKMTDRPIYEISHHFWESYDMQVRHRFAKSFLYLYNSASCVVSRRMHACLPSLSLGTPTLLLDIELEKFPGRFDGLKELVNSMDLNDFYARRYDIDSPPDNPKDFLKVRKKLEKSCVDFTGYDNGSVIEPVNLPEVMGLLKCTPADREKQFHSIWKLETAKLVMSRFAKGRRPEYFDKE